MPENESRFSSSLPIPTYEEAISERSHSPASRTGAATHGSNAERESFLRSSEDNVGANQHTTSRSARHRRGDSAARGNYHAPTVESARSSYESDFTEPGDGSDEDAEELRRDLEEMEVQDPIAERRAQQRAWFSKQFKSITGLFSSLNLPSATSWRLPSFSSMQDRMPFLSERMKPNWPIVARLVGLFIIVAFVYALLVVRVFRPTSLYIGQQFEPESVRSFVLGNVDTDRLRKLVRELSYMDHMAGTKGDETYLAPKIKAYFEQAGLQDVYSDDYQVYLNYPQRDGRQVAIVDPPELRWVAQLEENVVPGNSSDHNQQLSFHGLSRSGTATGPLIYANYGSREDFNFLAESQVQVKGAIVLMRYYGFGEGIASRVKLAEIAGAVGCIIYSDPAEDGFRRGPVWPEGRWRTGDSVHRASVGLTGFVVGDVLTPGWGSSPEADRISRDNNPGLVNIPSLPLSWENAKPLLAALQNRGSAVPEHWIGGIPIDEDEENQWFTGHPSNSPTVEIKNLQDENEKQPIRNILGRLEGVESPDQIVYVGNHRDAWCYGAVDASSGTAALLEVVRIFGELVTLGWRPRRTIAFASWDGAEYNLIGSTEHVEAKLEAIRQHGVAYINVDVGVSGPNFRAASSPVLQRTLMRNLNRVADPNSNRTLRTLWEDNKQYLERLTAKSDYVPFQSIAGVASLDIGFQGPEHGYPTHSCYETADWMEKYGDPNYDYHTMLVQLWTLLILDLADEPLLSFDFLAYSWQLTKDIPELKQDIAHMMQAHNSPENPQQPPEINFERLDHAAAVFVANAKTFHEFETAWERQIVDNEMAEDRETSILRNSYNAHMAYFDSNLLDIPGPNEDGSEPTRQGGPPTRPQFKHVLYGPPRWDGISKSTFPAVRDAMEDGDWKGVQAFVDIAGDRIRFAAERLLN